MGFDLLRITSLIGPVVNIDQRGGGTLVVSGTKEMKMYSSLGGSRK